MRSTTWDSDPYLLGTPDATINLRTGAKYKAKPEDHITRMTAVSPAPKGTVPTRWLQFLEEATGRDQETDLAKLNGARLVATAENNENDVWDETRIKQLTGGAPRPRPSAAYLHAASGQPRERRAARRVGWSNPRTSGSVPSNAPLGGGLLVNFMIVGAQKCGTTTLFDILKRHPELVGCREKEPHFFSTTKDWQRDLPRYHALFPSDDAGLRFEGSTTYTFYPHRNLQIWNDLYAYNPDLRFLYVVRRPIDRIVSAYVHHVRRDYTKLPLEEAVMNKPLYLDVTRYAMQIRPFVSRFGRDRVLILDFDDLVRRESETMQRVADFLGVDADGFGPPGQVHSNRSVRSGGRNRRLAHLAPVRPVLRRVLPGVYGALDRPPLQDKPRLSLEAQRILLAELAPEIDATGGLMDKDLSHWKELSAPAAALG